MADNWTPEEVWEELHMAKDQYECLTGKKPTKVVVGGEFKELLSKHVFAKFHPSVFPPLEGEPIEILGMKVEFADEDVLRVEE